MHDPHKSSSKELDSELVKLDDLNKQDLRVRSEISEANISISEQAGIWEAVGASL